MSQKDSCSNVVIQDNIIVISITQNYYQHCHHTKKLTATINTTIVDKVSACEYLVVYFCFLHKIAISSISVSFSWAWVLEGERDHFVI